MCLFYYKITACVIEVKNNVQWEKYQRRWYLRLLPLILGSEFHSRNRMSSYLFLPDFLVQIGHHAILREKSMLPRWHMPSTPTMFEKIRWYRRSHVIKSMPRYSRRVPASRQGDFSRLLIDDISQSCEATSWRVGLLYGRRIRIADYDERNFSLAFNSWLFCVPLFSLFFFF